MGTNKRTCGAVAACAASHSPTCVVKAEAAVSQKGSRELPARLQNHPGDREGCRERVQRARRCMALPWADLMAVDMEVEAPV